MSRVSNILISGASGFVGSNLSTFLRSNDFEISTLSRKQIDENNVTYDHLTVNNFNAVNTFIHLAGKAHDLENTSLDDEYYQVNTELTKTLFDLFLESNCKTFIYFSSVKAVADEVEEILTEDHPYEPKTVYGKSKALAEQYLLNKKLPQDKRLYILRPCMIHGPGNKGNLNLLYKVVLKGIPYPLAAFYNKRSFVSIDTINIVIYKLLMQLPDSDIFNMADDYAISTNELIETIASAIDKKPRLMAINPGLINLVAGVGSVLKLPLNKERLQKLTESYQVSNRKIKEALKITISLDTRKGLEATIKSFKNT